MSLHITDQPQTIPVRRGIPFYAKRIAAAFAGLFVGLQLVPIARPPSDNLRSGVIPTQRAGMPPDLAHTMQRACGNCHSNWTNWPWYSHVAPVSWLVAKDVARGRQSLNFSEWKVQDSRTAALAASRLLATCANLSGGTMPPASYQFMHPESRLPQAEIDAYCKWSRAEADSLLGKKLNGYKEKAPSQ